MGALRGALAGESQTAGGQWIDGPDKTSSNGVGDEDLGVKPDEEESVGRRGALQLEVPEPELEASPDLEEGTQEAPPDPAEEAQETPPDPGKKTREAPSDRGEKTDPEEKTREALSNLEKGTKKALPNLEEGAREALLHPEQETRELPLDRKEKTREAPSDLEKETLEAPSDPDEETQEVPLDPEETQNASPNLEGETREAPSDPGVETNDVAGLAAGSTDLKGPVIPAPQKLTISGNLPPNNVNMPAESPGARRREKSSAAKCSADERGRWRGECVDVRRRGHDDVSKEGGATRADSEGHATGEGNREETMNSL